MLLFAGIGGFDGGFTIAGLDTLGPDPLLEGVFGILILLPGLEEC